MICLRGALHLIDQDCAGDPCHWTLQLLDWVLFDRWRQAWEGSQPTTTTAGRKD